MVEKVANEIMDALELLVASNPNETDWLAIKKKLCVLIPSHLRKTFTKRDEKTKLAHPFNDNEQAVRKTWFSLTGNLLVIPIEKRLDPTDETGYL